MKDELQSEEVYIQDAILAARKIQNYLWGDLSYGTVPVDVNEWVELFQKRVDKIKEVDLSKRSGMVELRKRVLQQAALSIKMLHTLDKLGIKQ